MRWINSTVIEPNLLYGVSFWWTALDRQHNVRLLGKVRRSAAIYITGALRSTSTKALFAMLNWIPTTFAAARLNATSRWHIVPSGHSTIFMVDPVTPVNIDYLIRKYRCSVDLLSGSFISVSLVWEQETDHFLCQWPSLATCRYRLFGSTFLVNLTELSSIDIKDIASFIKFSGRFSSALALTNFFPFPCFGITTICYACSSKLCDIRAPTPTKPNLTLV